MPRFYHAAVPSSTTPHRPVPAASTSIFDFAEHFMKEHEEVAPPSNDAGALDDAMDCSHQSVDPPPKTSQSVASASQQERPAPVYAELWGRLKWLSVINEKTLEGMYSKGDLQAMLRRHAIHAASGRKKSELAVELMRLMRAQGLSKPDEPTAATEPPAAITSSSAAAVSPANTIAAAATTITTSAAGSGGVGSSGALGPYSLADRLVNMCRGPPAEHDDDETQPPLQSQRVVPPAAPPPPAIRAAPRAAPCTGVDRASSDRLRAALSPPSRDPTAAAAPPPPAAAARPPPQAAAPPARAAAAPPAAAPEPAAALPSPRLMTLSAAEEHLLQSLKARAVPPAWPAGCFAALALDLARLPRAAGLHATAQAPPTSPANSVANAAAAANGNATYAAAAAAAAATAAPSSLPTRASAAAPAPTSLRAARPAAALKSVACPNCHGSHDRGAPCVAPQRGNFDGMVAKALRMVRTATADEAAAALRAAGGSFSDAVAALRRSAPLVPSRRATPTDAGASHPQSSEGSGSGGWGGGGGGGGWGSGSGGRYEGSRPCSDGADSDSDDQDCGQHAPPGGLPRAGGSSGSETEMEI